MSLKILNPGYSQAEQWLSEDFSVTDPGNDIDIVVLTPPISLLQVHLDSITADSSGILLGGSCEFLGFPIGGAWRAPYANGPTSWMPFVKHCTVSALAVQPERIWILDDINNVGFSGGPVFFWNRSPTEDLRGCIGLSHRTHGCDSGGPRGEANRNSKCEFGILCSL